ncbi:MAG: DNA mismatch repair protein MutS [Acidobacteria bacterium]|nr:DNA mismatch repair protein MutS [Acidobacteriota bacterium]
MSDASTPLMRQYQAIKKQYPQTLLLFRLGDFYELFFEDAVVASRILQITLTSRNKEKGQAIPMCGVPYHAAEGYLARLIRAGHRVAICDQMEEPSKGVKLVRRAVVRVVTPGTATEAALLEPKENNFLAAIAPGPVHGLAYVDVSTGEFRVTEFPGADADSKLRDELDVLRPREVLLPRPSNLFSQSPAIHLNGLSASETQLDDWIFHTDFAERLLTEQFRVVSLDGFGLADHPQATAAAGAVLHYLKETSAIRAEQDGASKQSVVSALEHLDRPVFYQQQNALILDAVSVRNLELVAPFFEDAGPRSKSPTLLSTLDETATGMGARLLRSWILRPSIDRAEIEARLDAVTELKSQTVIREELRKELASIGDLERLTSRISLGTSAPRELLALGSSLDRVPIVRRFLVKCQSPRLHEIHDALDEMPDVRERIASTIADDPPALTSEPGVIRQGVDVELDELRNLSRDSKQIIAAMEERERKRTGIASLKIRFNQIFGYYIEISKPNLHLAPNDYERKQTLVNAERFTAPELKEYERKILDADAKILTIERRLFDDLRSWLGQQTTRLRRTASAIAQLDVLACFGHLAAQRNYIRPEFPSSAAESGDFFIAGGRHPVIEKLCEDRGERFVPNDLFLNSGTHQVLLITGPNMGGKSTYLRQAALIVLMAQVGSFVPASQARLPITDRIFTRIGASDNLARGRSTFLVEMTEVAAILNTATSDSLVLLDEVGRGTATFDGLSIAWAVVEHLHIFTRARTLFATHYHELTELAELLEGVKNVHVSVKESGSEIIFLRRVEPGSADKSYGIEVARLAGLPASVIARAREVLARHEQSEHQLGEELSPGAASGKPPVQESMFTPLDREVLDALREADLDNLKPLDALNLLAKLKKQIK